MDKPSFKLVGSPCGQHGQYTFYKALRISGETERIVAIGDFFFVKIWQDSELISIGELQLLWTDRVSDQTLVSLRLYFLPENTPDGRNQHGEDEVLAINDKVVVRAEDLLSWVCSGEEWSTGLRAVWRGACAPPQEARQTAPLHHTKLDFTDVDSEKSTIAIDSDAPGVVVFSYPRYCRYRALLSRLEGIQADWLRDSLVAALGGYAAPTNNTRILYCKDTFEYPQLEEHEFVCNHLAPKLKGRPRGRRKRPLRSHSHSPSSRSSDSDVQPPPFLEPRTPQTPRRLSLRNGTDKSEEEDDKLPQSEEDRAFLQQVRRFHRDRGGHAHVTNLRDMTLRTLYTYVTARGGHAAVSAARGWRGLNTCRPARARHHYERFLLPYEIYERKTKNHFNGKIEDTKPVTIDVPDSPLRESPPKPEKIETKPETPEKRLRTPSPVPKKEEKTEKEELDLTSKPAEELNREFLDSLPKDEKVKISVKPVEKLIAPDNNVNSITKLFEENSGLISELSMKYNVKEVSKVVEEIGSKQLSDGSTMFLSELAQRLNFGNADTTVLKELSVAQQQLISGSGNALSSLSAMSDKYASQGHATDQKNSKPAGRSSLRHVRVRPSQNANSGTLPRAGSSSSQSSSSPPAAPAPAPAPHAPTAVNFGIHRAPPIPPAAMNVSSSQDDDIVEVPYKPKTPEIIDLDEYPESPQSVKKKKLDILKERGLEVTALPTWGAPVPLLAPPAVALAPAVQHQIMTQASLFHMYNVIPPNYANGIQPPKVIQATSIYGSSGPEKTVYGNPKDPFMPPPHVLHGTPVKPQRVITSTPERPQDILDLTCKNPVPTQKPAVEIVRIPPAPSPSKNAQNQPKNYTLVDGKAVVGSNLEITLVNPKTANTTPVKTRPPQKRSSNGKFVSTKTPPPKPTTPTSVKKPPIVVPNYQITRDDVSPTSSTGSRDSQSNLQNLQNAFKTQPNLTQLMDMQKNMPLTQNLSQIMDMQKNMPLTQNLSQIMDMQKNMPMTQMPFMDPVYMSALYNSLAGQMDQRQLAMYRDLMTSQFRNYSGLLGSVTPTTKN